MVQLFDSQCSSFTKLPDETEIYTLTDFLTSRPTVHRKIISTSTKRCNYVTPLI